MWKQKKEEGRKRVETTHHNVVIYQGPMELNP
jgi:hypothetical protein